MQVVYDFYPKETGKLKLCKGDFITVLDKSNSVWWKGICNGRENEFPVTYVKEI